MKLSRNILSGWGYIAVNTVIVLFMTPFLVRSLGVSNFGVWALILTVIGYLNLLDFGSQQAQARFLSRALGKEDSEHFRDIFSNTAILFFVIGTVILVAVLVLGQFGEGVFNVDLESRDEFRMILWIVGTMVAVEFMSKSYGGSLAARERLDIINLIEIVGAIVQAILVFGALTLGWGLIGMAGGVAVTMAVKILAYVAVGHAAYPHARITFRRFDKSIMRKLLGYGSISYIIVVSDLVKTNLGILIIGAFLTTTDAAYYSIAAQFVFYFFLMGRSVNSAFIPRISRLEGQGNWAVLREQFILGTRIISVVVIFVGSSMMIFGGKFIELWLGKGFEASFHILAILAPAAMFNLMQSISTSFMFATSNHGVYAKLNVLEAVAGVIIGLVLVRPLGPYGIALGVLIPAAFFRIGVQPFVTCRLVGISLREYFARGFRRQLVFGVAYVATAVGGLQMFSGYVQTLWQFFLMAAGFLAVGAFLVYVICITAEERSLVLARMRKRWLLRQQSAP